MQDEKWKFVKSRLFFLANEKEVDGIRGLASLLNDSEDRFYGWVKRNSIADPDVLLGEFPNIRREWLIRGEGEPYAEPKKSRAHVDISPQNPDDIVSSPAIGLPEPVSRRVEVVSVPVYGRVPAGTPSQFVEEVERLGIPGVPERTFGLIVSGSSMLLPDGTGIRDGEYALCVSNLELEPQHNDIVVVNDEYGDSMLKRLKINKDGGFELVSDNPAYQRIIPNSGYSIVGVVIETWFRTVHKRYR